eukprot:CAMPEP_0183296544 /NCGR_PEP_ID=MMETSP0160_2-20130417/4046_1 /TAXON_ID=2839 ORGANISM="Odontella Sinensis, Strain Grunow 1884" /NCGR_SAMPLE_ID=MMETSP0160_2 /ASSEMBLY_ACC=CAM_ASM_000250 /LENGTH=230 /DNA_ID=CAMNT_0025458163 /DNA_START=71 /DNA_END=763 /DNA_ORIENTATION=+
METTGTSILNVTGCWNLDFPRPIWDQSTWVLLRETYRDIVGLELSSIPNHHDSGFFIPYEVHLTDGKGRGVFATEKITKGQKVWTERHTAQFHEDQEEEFRSFLAAIPYELACDILQWAYVQKKDGSYAASVDLDDCSYLNHARDGNNVVETWDATVAGRDIEVGEELLTDYTSFDEDGKLIWFDDLADLAWDKDDSGDDDEDEDEGDPDVSLFFAATGRSEGKGDHDKM